MVITKTELKTTTKALLLSAGTWLVVIPLREVAIEVSPIKNTVMIGLIMIGAVLFWD